jgi:hypothetical protein
MVENEGPNRSSVGEVFGALQCHFDPILEFGCLMRLKIGGIFIIQADKDRSPLTTLIIQEIHLVPNTLDTNISSRNLNSPYHNTLHNLALILASSPF